MPTAPTAYLLLSLLVRSLAGCCQLAEPILTARCRIVWSMVNHLDRLESSLARTYALL